MEVPTAVRAPRVLATLSPADLYTQPGNTEIAQSDMLRARRYLARTYPRPLPAIREWTPGARRAVLDSFNRAEFLVIDTEYVPHVRHSMFTLGIGGPDTDIWQWWPKHPTSAPGGEVRDTLRELISARPVWFQNAMADLPILDDNLGIKYEDFMQVEDTMFLHSLLWTELPHDLEFLASVYGAHEKLKHLPMNDPRYNAGDIAETVAVVEGLSKEGDRDPQTMWVYRNCMLPLIPIILEAQSLGIKVDRQAVAQAQILYEHNRQFATQLAASYAGFPLNLGSSAQLVPFLNHDLPQWGLTPKKKGAALVTSADEDTIASLRERILPFDPQLETTIEHVQARLDQGAHPILEARVLYARATQWSSHYIEPFLASSDGRIYPHFHPWTQNTGRWSTVNPPVAQLPHPLRNALVPDDGWCWFEFDFSAIELRLIAALSGDKIMLEAFEKNWDLHTLHMCQGLGLPHPKGWTKKDIKEDIAWRESIGFVDDDPRRTFFKQLVFRLCVPMDTQALTRTGWKTYDQLEVGDVVLGYNQETKQKEWTPVLEKFYYDAAPVVEMHHNKGFVFRSTPDHRWFVYKRTWNGRSWDTNPYWRECVQTTEEINTESNVIVNAPMTPDLDDAACTLDLPKYGTTWSDRVCMMSSAQRRAFLQGFFLADGHWSEAKPGYQKVGHWTWSQNAGEIHDAVLTAAFIETGKRIHVAVDESRGLKKGTVANRAHITGQKLRKTNCGVQPVWCIHTALGSWVARQGDSVAITGNCYGGVPEGAPSIPGAKTLGLKDAQLIAASKKWIAAHPWVKRFWTVLVQTCLKQRQARTFLGRRWSFMGHDPKRIQRQIFDFPMQGAVADIANLVLIQIKRELGADVQFRYQMHDSLKLQVRINEQLATNCKRIIAIAEQPWKINGASVCFPVEWHMRGGEASDIERVRAVLVEG